MATKPTRDRKNSTPFDLAANWSTGPRPPGWDALWRRLVDEAILPALNANGQDEPPTSVSA